MPQTDQPDPADPAALRDALRRQLAGRQESADFQRHQRLARTTLAAHPELRRPFDLRNWAMREREGQR
jgi:hypothetical protein